MTELAGEHGPITLRVDSFGMPTLCYDGWELILVRGKYDGVPVLFIGTQRFEDAGHVPETEQGPRCRILLNDEPVWNNPSYSIPPQTPLDPDDQPIE